jgi:DNA polymerase III epsilon subunit-like protein
MMYHTLEWLNGNVLATVDVETTGRLPAYHEIIQIAVLPIDANFEPFPGVLPFYTNIAPEYPERSEIGATMVHGIDLAKLKAESLDRWRVADLFDEWFQSLKLPLHKKLVPLAHNWPFESGFLKDWLGTETMDALFHPYARDSMQLTIALNDIASMRGLSVPFDKINLVHLCKRFAIPLDHAHNALEDAIATAKLYKILISQDHLV